MSMSNIKGGRVLNYRIKTDILENQHSELFIFYENVEMLPK